MSDSKLRIRNIVARWPGSTHDQRIFDNSLLKTEFEEGKYGSSVLIGDSGYANRPYLVTPLLDITTPAEDAYNQSVLTTRNTVERKYGCWKNRYPAIGGKMRMGLKRTCTTIIATGVLHNICIEMNLPVWEEVSVDPRRIDPPAEPNADYERNDGMRRRLIDEYFATRC